MSRRVVRCTLTVLALAGPIAMGEVAGADSQTRAVVIVPSEELAGVGRVAEAMIAGFEYYPAELEIETGTTVVWINGDRFDHDVTVVASRSPAPEDVRSELVNYNEKIAMTFSEPGRYMYICSVHPFMQGSVTVKPAAGVPEE